jgi:hypothetical protein
MVSQGLRAAGPAAPVRARRASGTLRRIPHHLMMQRPPAPSLFPAARVISFSSAGQLVIRVSGSGMVLQRNDVHHFEKFSPHLCDI